MLSTRFIGISIRFRDVVLLGCYIMLNYIISDKRKNIFFTSHNIKKNLITDTTFHNVKFTRMKTLKNDTSFALMALHFIYVLIKQCSGSYINRASTLEKTGSSNYSLLRHEFYHYHEKTFVYKDFRQHNSMTGFCFNINTTQNVHTIYYYVYNVSESLHRVLCVLKKLTQSSL